MKQAIVIGLLSLFAAGCPVLSPKPAGDIRFSLHLPNTGIAYSVYAPPWHTPTESWPLLISLHGTYGYDDHQRQVKELAYLCDQYGFVVAAPQLDSVQGILPVPDQMRRPDLRRDREVVLALIDTLTDEYNIDKAAVCLSGFSAGGFVMFDVGLRYPELFQMLVGRSCNSSTDIFEHIEFSDAARALPIHLFWGKSDPADKMGWKAYEYLRMRRFFNTTMDEVDGGHWRHPRIAVEAWLAHWTPYHLSKAQRLGQTP